MKKVSKILALLLVAVMVFALVPSTAFATGCDDGKGTGHGSYEPVEEDYTISITYLANGATSGTVPVDPTEYELGEFATVLGNTGNLQKTGFVFAGWNYGIIPFQPGSKMGPLLHDVVLYANWQLSTEAYTVTVLNDGNGTAYADKSAAKVGEQVTLTAIPNEGYRFKKWEVVSGNAVVVANVFLMGVENVTLKAVFEPTGKYINIKTDKTAVKFGGKLTVTATDVNEVTDDEEVLVYINGASTGITATVAELKAGVAVPVVKGQVPAGNDTVFVRVIRGTHLGLSSNSVNVKVSEGEETSPVTGDSIAFFAILMALAFVGTVLTVRGAKKVND